MIKVKKVAIIGAGLSGLLTAQLISEYSKAEITIIEKGISFEDRIKSLDPDMLSGVGGAGTVYGGKFCLPPASSGIWKKTKFKNNDFSEFSQKCIAPFLKESVSLSMDNFCEYLHKGEGLYIKHYDSRFVPRDKMQQFVLEILNKVRMQKVYIRSNCEFVNVEKKENGFLVVYRSRYEQYIKEHYDYLIFASGRFSADKITKWLRNKVNFQLQNPDLGIRFTMNIGENELFSEVGKDVKIKKKLDEIIIRTFCVCVGGDGTLLNMKGMKYFDGHFGDEITNKVNLGILARSPYIFGFEGAALYCSYLQKYIKSDLSLKDYVKYANKLIKDTDIFDDIMNSIKVFVLLLQQNGILGNNLDNYPVLLPSVDRLNPIISVNQNFETSCKNLYVIGDATGLSRGFLQSMWSAYCVSNNLISNIEKEEDKMVV